MRLVFKKKTNERAVHRMKKKARIRKKVYGTAERPRLCVYRGTNNIYAQLIDDVANKTVASVSSIKMPYGSNTKAAVEVGKQIAELAKNHKIEKVVFDRNGFIYHGRIKALADSAREAGLQF